MCSLIFIIMISQNLSLMLFFIFFCACDCMYEIASLFHANTRLHVIRIQSVYYIIWCWIDSAQLNILFYMLEFLSLFRNIGIPPSSWNVIYRTEIFMDYQFIRKQRFTRANLAISKLLFQKLIAKIFWWANFWCFSA